MGASNHLRLLSRSHTQINPSAGTKNKQTDFALQHFYADDLYLFGALAHKFSDKPTAPRNMHGRQSKYEPKQTWLAIANRQYQGNSCDYRQISHGKNKKRGK
jgi:hypothetical protein